MSEKEFLSIAGKPVRRQSAKLRKVKTRLEKGEVKIKETVEPKRVQKRSGGVIYVGHLPHGFFEKEMKDYFTQFGKVTHIHLSRSKKTGASKGYAFVQFQHEEVAKVVAETMNNYLMMKKLLKASFIPNDKVPDHIFSKKGVWNTHKYPALFNRKQKRFQYNKNLNEKALKEKLTDRVKTVNKALKKLRKKGIVQSLEIVDKPAGHESLVIKGIEKRPILEIDESDEEITLKPPPGAITKVIRRKSERISGIVKKNNKVTKGTKTNAIKKLKMGLLDALKKR